MSTPSYVSGQVTFHSASHGDTVSIAHVKLFTQFNFLCVLVFILFSFFLFDLLSSFISLFFFILFCLCFSVYMSFISSLPNLFGIKMLGCCCLSQFYE
jgi:ABC-type transport system involved in multi-copper enzyme maturation permease subunit